MKSKNLQVWEFFHPGGEYWTWICPECFNAALISAVEFPPAYKDVYRDRQEQADNSEYNYRVHILNLIFPVHIPTNKIHDLPENWVI